MPELAFVLPYVTEIQNTGAGLGCSSEGSLVMLGCRNTFVAKSNKALVLYTASVGSSVPPNQTSFQIAYGTGTPPSNGASATGTTIGQIANQEMDTNVDYQTQTWGLMLNLTVGQTYWVDIQAEVSTSTTTTFDGGTFEIIQYVQGAVIPVNHGGG